VRFRLTNPILTDGHDGVLAGHEKLCASITCGLSEIAIVPLGTRGCVEAWLPGVSPSAAMSQIVRRSSGNPRHRQCLHSYLGRATLQ